MLVDTLEVEMAAVAPIGSKGMLVLRWRCNGRLSTSDFHTSAEFRHQTKKQKGSNRLPTDPSLLMQFVEKVERGVPTVKLDQLLECVMHFYLSILLLLLFVRVLVTHARLLLSIIMDRDIISRRADNSELNSWRQPLTIGYYVRFNKSLAAGIRSWLSPNPNQPNRKEVCC